jgi:3-isopropylmalate/(R)-2-methylmalate dehydratase large subunit
MGMTAAEKILARASGKSSVKPGDVVYPDPELVFVHDGYIASSKSQLDELGIRKVFDENRVVFITDHIVVYTTPKYVERGKAIRAAAKDWNIKHFFDVGQGGHGHIFPLERGMILPGSFAFANDMHCTNFGAVGALVMRSGTEIITVLATGTMWVEVPKSIRITLTGRFKPGVYMRDLGYRLAKNFSSGAFGLDWDYRVLEFAGDALENFGVGARVAAINTATEIGVANVFFPPSQAIIKAARAIAKRPFEPVFSDPDARYEAELTIDLSELVPQVSLPGNPDDAVDIGSVEGQPIDHAYIGACGSGMYEDMVSAARILKGRKVAAGTRLFIVPGTTDLARRLVAENLFEVYQEAGAIVLPAGCGPCAGGNTGPLAPGEVSICTAATNSAGRFGATDARIYLGSPATVAASAVNGRITDPRTFSDLAPST